MQTVSFFDRKKITAGRIIGFSFWDNNPDYILDKDIACTTAKIHEKIQESKTDILIAVTDGADVFSPERIREIKKTTSRMKIIVIGRNSAYEIVRQYFTSDIFDYLLEPVAEKTLEETVLRMNEDNSIEYVMNNLKVKADALIDNILLGGGREEPIITGIFNKIYRDWKNDFVSCQKIANRAKSYIYEILIEQKPWLEKFLFKNDFTCHFGFTLKSREELIKNWIMNFTEASAMVKKYQMIDDKMVYKIGRYAVVHIDERLSLDDVSKGVFLNSSYVSHIFKKTTGVNFIDFMTSVKIDRAKVLLRDPEIRINKVSSILGFANQEYFTKNFKRKTGSTPSEYKKILISKYSES